MARRSRWIHWVVTSSADPRIPLPWTRDTAPEAAFRSSRVVPG